MHVAIDRTFEVSANVLRNFEVELESRDQVDMKCVEILEKGLQPEPVPRRNTARELLTATLGALVVEIDLVVEMRDFDRFAIGRELFQRVKEFARTR